MKKKPSRGATELRPIADHALAGASGAFTGLSCPASSPAPRPAPEEPTSSISFSYGSIRWSY